MTDEVIYPNFFIVGAPKCATTAMAHYLGMHREIFMPAQKELHYFGKDLISKNRKGGIYSLEMYLSFFREARNQKFVGEASVLYLYSETAAHEIKRFAPDSKIIIMLRNPIDVMYALHSQLLSQADEDIQSFEAALAAEPFRAVGQMLPRGIEYIDDGLLYRSVVRFTSQVQRYLDIFGRNNVRIVLYDDILSDIRKEYRSLLRYLGVDDQDFLPDFNIINGNKQARFPGLQRFVRYPPKWFIGLTRAWVPKGLALDIRARVLSRNVRFSSRETLDVSLRRSLALEFESEILSLGSLIGRDLSGWLRVD